MRIVIPDDAPPVMGASQAFRRLLDRAPVEYHDTLPGTEERLIERIAGAAVVINIRSSTKFPDRVLAACPALRLLSLWGTGTDNVDLDAARARGVTVTNTPGVAAPAIAEHCLALLLAVARHIPRVDAAVRVGAWPRGQSIQLAGRTLGIIGLGAIGRRFAQLGAAVGMRVVCWTMHPDPALGFTLAPLDRLLAESDVVSLHLRLSPQTERFLGKPQFDAMKKGAIFLNTARGPIVDEVALLAALRSGHLAGAGLDVFEVEPLPAGHPLTEIETVVLTPHSAGVTPETVEAGLAMAIQNVWDFLDGRPANVVG